jgi:hypothetical protein
LRFKGLARFGLQSSAALNCRVLPFCSVGQQSLAGSIFAAAVNEDSRDQAPVSAIEEAKTSSLLIEKILGEINGVRKPRQASMENIERTLISLDSWAL